MGRMLLARVLVVIGALLAVVALLAGYIRYQALDTGTVENTAGELIADDAIRDQVAASLVDELFNNVDVQAAINQRLPPELKGLAGPITGGVRIGRRARGKSDCSSGRGSRSCGSARSPRLTARSSTCWKATRGGSRHRAGTSF